jgi:hypothetical protein
MQMRIFASLLLCSLFLVLGGDAQNLATMEKPVWTLEIIKARPDKLGLTMGYLDDHWMRAREEAKRQGKILSYHRFQQAMLLHPGSKEGDPNTIMLLTEYKNLTAYDAREKLFASISEHLPSETPGVLKPWPQDDLYESVNTSVFLEVPDTGGTGFKLLAKQ